MLKFNKFCHHDSFPSKISWNWITELKITDYKMKYMKIEQKIDHLIWNLTEFSFILIVKLLSSF